MPILPVFAGARDIRLLNSLVACAKQQNDLGAGYCVVDSVARSNVDSQLPNAVTARLVVSEVPQLNAIDAPVDGDPRLGVTELAMPLQK